MQNAAVLLILLGRKYKMYYPQCNCDSNERSLVRVARTNDRFCILIWILFRVVIKLRVHR